MDEQCQRRYGSKEVECITSNGSGVGQKQMETSSSAASSSLKWWKRESTAAVALSLYRSI